MYKRFKSLSDEELMKHLQDGSESAFNEIYNRYSKRLLHFMYRMYKSDETLAQDTLHDVFLKLIENPDSFDASRKFKPWIYRVASNECNTYFRKKALTNIQGIDSVNVVSRSNVVEHIDNSKFNKALEYQLNKMSYEHKCTFVLRFQEKLSLQEIAVIMECPLGTVKSRVHHSIKILAKKLEEYNPINI